VLACKKHCAIVKEQDGKKRKQKNGSKINKTTTEERTIWRVQVMCEGVGGFAVGVASKNTAYPFKSLGNRGDAWVLHSSGHLLYNRSQTALERGRDGERERGGGAEYGEGDVIEIEVWADGRLGFKINEEEVGTGVVLPPGEYVLCCQPYMGGGGQTPRRLLTFAGIAHPASPSCASAPGMIVAGLY
jgi:hypothetical protein